MKKNFTVPVPDELYITANTLGKTMTLSYDGPATIDCIITPGGDFLGTVPYEGYVAEPSERVVALNANTDTAVAYLTLPAPDPEFTFEEQTMEDGSVWLNNTNPRLHDYYMFKYNINEENWVLVPKVKDFKTPGLVKAENRKLQLEKGILIHGQIDNGSNNEIVSFLSTRYAINSGNTTADDVVATINDYIAELDEFIDEESAKYMWKYETHEPVPDAPELIKPVFEE
jgi:hypothetical protein